jgi:CTP:molybdopterin cytidylyltransferase MocA
MAVMASTEENASAPLALRNVGLVVLAAGQSARMGSPKALVRVEGRALLEHLLAVPLLRDIGDVVVVVGHRADALRRIVDRLGYRCVLNPDPDRGRTGSVQEGLRALGAAIRAVFVQPVDCPMILPETYRALVAAIGPCDVAIPSHQGKHGHPPLVSAALIPRILAARPDQPLRDLLRAGWHGDACVAMNMPPMPTLRVGMAPRCRFVEVDDPGVLVNVDRPEDLAQLLAVYSRRGRLLTTSPPAALPRPGSVRPAGPGPAPPRCSRQSPQR